MSRRFLAVNFFILIFVVFVFTALGQWNGANFQRQAAEKARDLMIADLEDRGLKVSSVIEPDISMGSIQIGSVTEDGRRIDYEIGITNPDWVQLSALNLLVEPKLAIIAVSGNP